MDRTDYANRRRGADQKRVHRKTTIGDLLADPILGQIAQDMLSKFREGNPLMNTVEMAAENSCNASCADEVYAAPCPCKLQPGGVYGGNAARLD